MAETISRRTAGGAAEGFGRGARILSVGIASTGALTFLYFALASHLLPAARYGELSLLWAVLFVVISVIYRPVEQLLSRTIARRRALGLTGHRLTVALAIQAGFAIAFLAAALALRPRLEGLFGSHALYDVFVGATLAYAASYFARGYLAGHARFGLYGGLVMLESSSRCCFALAAAVGIAHGQTAIALGILAAPLVSLLVVPGALARHHGRAVAAAGAVPVAARDRGPAMRAGASFAVAVAGIQLAEQTLLNVAVLTARATGGAAIAGIVFNVLLITRAPLQLFQAVQTSLLPHLSRLEATDGHAPFRAALRRTAAVIAAFAGLVALALLAVGPLAMRLLFGPSHEYGRFGLAVIAVGMGFHLAAGTLNQAALARGRARAAAARWLACAGGFAVWMLLPVVAGEVHRAEAGYALATATLCVLLLRLEMRRC